mmetsp:Transcript_35077/g.109193  ORF Transcript_35077/g.109193 Transcript_35077/m.109193 type:complete len:342 (-) Transcript_35077:11-1036(-)
MAQCRCHGNVSFSAYTARRTPSGVALILGVACSGRGLLGHCRGTAPAAFCGAGVLPSGSHFVLLDVSQRLVSRAAHRKPLERTSGNVPRENEVVYRPPPLPQSIARRLEDLTAAFQSTYLPPSVTRQELSEENARYFRRACSNQAWEEVDQTSVAELLQAARLCNEHSFVDVGSGLGKLVVIAAAVTEVRTAWGVELSPSRAAEAVRAADSLSQDGHITESERARVRLVQGNCVDLPDEALAATHFLFAIRHVGKLPRGARQVTEVLLDALARRPLAGGEPRVIWSVGKRLAPREGLVHTRSSWVGAEWAEGRGVLTHEYALRTVDGEGEVDLLFPSAGLP